MEMCEGLLKQPIDFVIGRRHIHEHGAATIGEYLFV